MGERERPAAPGGVELHLGAAEGLHADADLDVPQLADEEVALRALRPPEEHVAGGLHEPVAVDDALAVVGEDARAGVRLQHRGARLLDLEEEGVALAGHEEEHPAGGADAADPHHLDGGVAELVAVEQRLVRVGERGPVARPARPGAPAGSRPGGCPSAWKMVGSWSLMTGISPLCSTSFGKMSSAMLFALLLLQALEGPLAEAGILDAGDQLVGRDRPVPELQRLHLAELGHGLAVGADAGRGHVRGHGLLQAVVPAGHDEAGASRFTSHSHGAGSVSSRSLMEKMTLPLRGGEAAEVAQVGVAAALDADARWSASGPGRPPW